MESENYLKELRQSYIVTIENANKVLNEPRKYESYSRWKMFYISETNERNMWARLKKEAEDGLEVLNLMLQHQKQCEQQTAQQQPQKQAEW